MQKDQHTKGYYVNQQELPAWNKKHDNGDSKHDNDDNHHPQNKTKTTKCAQRVMDDPEYENKKGHNGHSNDNNNNHLSVDEQFDALVKLSSNAAKEARKRIECNKTNGCLDSRSDHHKKHEEAALACRGKYGGNDSRQSVCCDSIRDPEERAKCKQSQQQKQQDDDGERNNNTNQQQHSTAALNATKRRGADGGRC